MATELNTPQNRVRFGEFEFDCITRELKKSGRVMRLEPQPAKVLSVLVHKAGEIVTRQELIRTVWGADTFVDFDQGLNYAIRRIRAALEDDADAPRFLETVPKLGYRLIALISSSPNSELEDANHTASLPSTTLPRLYWVAIGASVLILVLFLAGPAIISEFRRPSPQIAEPVSSIAVLPLRNLSADPEQEYFSDGMTDELITDLAKSNKLRVTSHTSVERYKNTRVPLPEIAKQLGVDAIIEGTVMRSAGRVRITVQLIDSRSDQHLWADSYERDLNDILKLQDEVATQIASKIGSHIISPTDARMAVRDVSSNPNKQPIRPLNIEAHDAYLKGRYWWHRRGTEAETRGLQFFQRAVDLDPTYAPAWAGIADSYAVMAHHGGLQANEAMPKAETAALKALALDDSLAEAHASLALIKFSYYWDYATADEEFRRAIELDPNYATAHHWYSHYLVFAGRFEQALSEIQIARQLDPYSVSINTWSALIYYYQGQYERSAAQFRSTLELDPAFGPFVADDLARVYEQQENYPEAIKEHQLEWTAAGRPKDGELLRNAFLAGGPDGYWRRRVSLLKPVGRSGIGSALQLALVYSHMRDREQTLRWLEYAYQEHSPWINFMARDPEFAWLRTEPQFENLESRIGLLASGTR
ncbi:winged helix-turn-helix domain-containing tetratricopeptide repeat protein [Occallatibacter savannae]|uniref:winged helix-turn-helix domain-containing tetratricopeptide repeat protein n=1 Tax=Occallatibacter savannae TaxID=1002691 RepID=UPI000D697002|nr:winged helix-turn-helix domain-containing protein [Occallatibacter savannae]